MSKCKNMKYDKGYTYEEMKEFGEYFKEMRLSIGFKPQEMAEKLGVFRTTVSRWEQGVSVPHKDIAELIDRYKSIVREVLSTK